MVWSVRLKDSLAAAAVVIVATAGVAILAGPLAAGAALGVLLIAALAGVQLGARVQARVGEAATRVEQAQAREREAKLVAEVASSLLAAGPAETPSVGPRMEQALAEAGARLQLCHAPAARPGEAALPLRMAGGTGWLYLDRSGPWTKEGADRVQRALADLIGLAQERARIAESATEAEAARRADIEKTAVMHAISHDMRDPLTAITTAARALGGSDLSDHDRRELTAVVGMETSRLQRMVTDLLDLSRIEAGAVNPQPGWCDLGDMVGRSADHVRAHHSGLEVSIAVPADLPPVHADAAQLERVFTGLIENAAKFSPSGKPVEVRGICANGRVTIRVVDHGSGIPPAEHAHVFKPFARGTDPQRGSGLGLAICRGFVEANGGRITLQSRGREGSAFAVSFPSSQQPSVVG